MDGIVFQCGKCDFTVGVDGHRSGVVTVKRR